MKTKLLFLAFLISVLSWGQVTIFEYTNTTATIPSGWNLTNGAGSINIDQTTYLLVESASPKDEIVSDIYDLSAYTSATLTLNVATYGSGTNSPAKIEISYNGGTSYTEVFTTNTPTSATYISGGSFTFVGPLTSQVRIKITHNNNPGSFRGVRLRNIKLVATGSACTPPSPTFTISPSSPICIGIDATYTTQSGNTSYVWNVPGVLNTDYSIVSGGLGTNSNTVTIKWLTGGNKTVTVGYTESGCASTTPASSTISVSNATIAPTAPQTIPIGVNGNTLTVTETSTPISRVWKYGTAIGSYTTTTASTGLTYVPNFATANTYYVVCESTFACGTVTSNYVTINVNTPVITITGTPTLFTYAEGQGPSAYQTLNVSGTSLTDNITITVPANWELSTNTAFSAPSATVTLNKNATTHAVTSTPVYVRLKAGLSQGQYEFPTDTDFVATSTNAITKTADLDGEVTAPKAELELRGVFTDLTELNIIVNGDTTPYTLDNTEFASQFINIAQTKTFRIRNIGGLTLNVSSITLDNTADFSITASTPFVIAGATYTDFTITFQPQSMGDRTAIVTIVSSDLTDSPYTFTIKGLGKNAEIGVTGNAVDIPNGNTAISATDNTFIGYANGNPANPSTVSQNFVISNSGNVVLNISGITISGVDASQFSVSPTTTSIAAGATGTITVTFAPTSIGVKNAIINIANNDLTDSENPYTFAVQGNAVSYVTCAAGSPTLLYETGFESVENYTASNTYDNDTPFVVGSTNPQNWSVVRGNVSTTQAINTQSLNLRLYTSPAPYPNAYTNFELDNVAKVTFRARTPNAVTVNVSYSVDGGTNYINPETFSLTGVLVDVPTYTYTLSSSIEIDNVKIKFEIPSSVSRPSSGNKQLIIDDVKVYGLDTPAEKTWNGTAWSGDGLPPTASQKAIIDGDLTLPYTLALNSTTYDTLEACECQVNASRNLNVGNVSGTTPATLNIQGLLTNNGTINIYNNSSLVQHNNDVTNINSAGAVFNYERKATVKRYDYVYWSSPTIDFNMSGVQASYRYAWNPTGLNSNGGQGNWYPVVGNMETGKGYIFRVPNSYSTTSTPDNFTANFTGVPFNGFKSIEINRGNDFTGNGLLGIPRTISDDNWNLLGNPYPSAIGVNEFLNLNPDLEGFVYVWTHGDAPDDYFENPFYSSYTYNYDPNDYITINKTGTTSGPADYKIGAGQGFFVLMKSGDIPNTPATANVIFNNSIRSKDFDNTQFYRVSSNSPSVNDNSRLWLDLNSSQTSTRILIGYVSEATNDFDRMFDAFTENKNVQNFYSLISGGLYRIQGRALPFDVNDTVPLGFNAPASGSFSIGLANVDGLFTSPTQDIYLEDLEFGIIHDLRVNPYSFNATQGIHNSRFKLRYTNSVLGNEDFVGDSNTVFVVSNESLTVSSLKENITAIEIYDVLGRKLYQNKNVNTQSQIVNSIQKTNSGLIIYITLENGKQVVKKAIY